MAGRNGKVNEVWKELNAKMTAKRTRSQSGDRNKSEKTTTRELVVQRLTAEPDNKQTFHPVQTREFVTFNYDELTLENLKKACAAHFGLPMKACDILVSNKGPSCTNINQIPHRKDKVYLVRFVVDLETDNEPYNISSSESDNAASHTPKCAKRLELTSTKTLKPPQSFPASLSIDQLMRAGKFVKPVAKTRATLDLESFDVAQKEWVAEKPIKVFVENDKFSSGAFREMHSGGSQRKASPKSNG